jgi:hypothetical protein
MDNDVCGEITEGDEPESPGVTQHAEFGVAQKTT